MSLVWQELIFWEEGHFNWVLATMQCWKRYICKCPSTQMLQIRHSYRRICDCKFKNWYDKLATYLNFLDKNENIIDKKKRMFIVPRLQWKINAPFSDKSSGFKLSILLEARAIQMQSTTLSKANISRLRFLSSEIMFYFCKFAKLDVGFKRR